MTELLSDEEFFGQASAPVTPRGNQPSNQQAGNQLLSDEEFFGGPPPRSTMEAVGDTARALDITAGESVGRTLGTMSADLGDLQRQFRQALPEDVRGDLNQRSPIPDRQDTLDEFNTEGQRLVGDPTYAPRALATGAASAAGATVEGLGLLSEYLGAEGAGRAIAGAGRDVLDYAEEARGVIPEESRGFGTDIAEGVGSMGIYFIPGAAASVLARGAGVVGRGVAGSTAAGALAGPAGQSEAYNRAIQEGLSHEDALAVSVYGIPAGLVQVAPVGYILASLPREARGKLAHMAQAFYSEFTAESAGAMLQNVVEQSYNPERGTWDDTLYQGLTGGTSASVISYILQSLSRKGVKVERRPYTAEEITAATQQSTVPDTGPITQDQAAALAPEPAAASQTPATITPEQQVALGDGQQAIDPTAITREFLDSVAQAPPDIQQAPPPPSAITETGNLEDDGQLAFDFFDQEDPGFADPAAGPQEAGDALATVPEAPATIAEQTNDLLDPKNPRKAVFIPFETFEAGDVTEPFGTSIRPVRVDEGVIYVNTRKGFGVRDVRELYKQGRLNAVLGLGPFNKAEVAESLAEGNEGVAVTERTPEGTEVKAVAGTTETAPEQVAAVEAEADPENTVQVEDPAQVLGDREQGQEQDQTAQAAEQLTEAQQEEQQRQYEVETRRRRPTPQRAADVTKTAAEQTREQRRTGRLTLTRRPEQTEQETTPEAEEVTSEGTPRTFDVTTPEAEAAIEASRQQQTEARRQRVERLRQQVKAREQEERAETRTEAYDQVENRVQAGELSHEEEARQRVAVSVRHNKLSKKRADDKIEKGRIAGEVLEAHTPDAYEPVTDRAAKNALTERLGRALEDARKKGFTFGDKVTHPVNSNAIVWLNHIRMLHGKLQEQAKTKSGKGPTYDDLNQFLVNELALKRGDGTLLRQQRLEVGAQQKAPVQTADVAAEEVSTEALEAEDADAATGATTETDVDAVEYEQADAPARVTGTGKGRVRTSETSGAAGEARVLQKGTPEFEAAAASVTAPKARPKAQQAKEVSKRRSQKTAQKTPQKQETRAERAKREAEEWLQKNKDILEMQRDPSTGQKFVPDLARDGQERGMAVETMKFSRLREGLLSDEAMSDYTDRLRMFSEKQTEVQRAVSGQILKTFDRVINDVDVLVLEDPVFDRFAPNADGYYNSEKDYIAIRLSMLLDQTAALHMVAHEGAHAVFYKAIEQSRGDLGNPYSLYAQVRSLLDITKRYAERMGVTEYGLTNIHEFMSEAWSNPRFQEFLAGIPLSKSDRAALGIRGPQTISIKSAWHWLKSRLSDLFGIKEALTSAGYKPGTKSVLDAAMDIGGALIEAAPAAREAAGHSRGEISYMVSENNLQIARSLMGKGVTQEDALMAASAIAADGRFASGLTEPQLDALATRLKDARATQPAAKEAPKKVENKYSVQKARADERNKKLNDQLQRQLEEDFVPGKTRPRAFLLKLASNFQIAEIADRFFGRRANPVRDISRLIEKQRLDKETILRNEGAIVDKLSAASRSHTKQQWEEFSNLLVDVTSAEVHPDVPLDHANNKHLGKKSLAGTWKRKQHATLSARYNALPSDLKSLYQETRDIYTKLQNDVHKGLIHNVLRALGVDDAALAKRLHEGNETQADKDKLGIEVMHHIEALDQLRKLKGPYFNLVRRGNWVVEGTYEVTPPPGTRKLAEGKIEFKDRAEAISYSESLALRNTIKPIYVHRTTGEQWVTDANGKEVKISANDVDAEQRFIVDIQNKHIEFVTSRQEAKKIHSQLADKGLKMSDVTQRRYERDAPNSEMLSDQMRALMDTIDKRESTSNLSPAEKAELKGILNEVSLKYLGSTRLQSSRLPRRYIEGASRDVSRNAFDYIDSTSGYLARLDVRHDLETQMRLLEEQTRALETRGTGSGEGARMIANEISQRVLEPQFTGESWFDRQTQRLVSASFVKYLASPGYSLINSMQVAMLGLPAMAGQFGVVRAQYHITKAYKDVSAAEIVGGGAADTVRAIGGKKFYGDRFIDDAKRRLNPREREMIDHLVGEGLIDAEAGLEVARTMRRNQGSTLGSTVDVSLGYLENLTRALPQSIEAINRTVASLAAYRLHYAKYKDHGQAVAYASEVTHESQGLYSNSNAAPIFNHPTGRIALQFLKYPQLVWYMYGKNVGRVLHPMKKEDRIKGIKTLAYLTATHGVMAGVVGMLPWELLKIPMMVFKGLGITDVSWEEFEEDVNAWIAQMTDDDYLADLLTYGLPRMAGVDLSARIGLQNSLVFGEPQENNEIGWKGFLFDLAAGAGGGMLADMMKGTNHLVDGNFEKAAETLLPMKVMGDAAKAMNNFRAGKYDFQEMVIRTFGLMPERAATISRDISRNIRDYQKTRDARIDLEKEFMNAQTGSELARAAARIRAYNAGKGADERGISIDTLRDRRARDKVRYQ